jgi:hypothetical protein
MVQQKKSTKVTGPMQNCPKVLIPLIACAREKLYEKFIDIEIFDCLLIFYRARTASWVFLTILYGDRCQNVPTPERSEARSRRQFTGVTPFFRSRFPYLRNSPVMTMAYTFRARA